MNQGQREGREEPAKISPNTRYEYCSERLSPFGGLLALEKFMDAAKFKEVFELFYQPPSRMPDQGHYKAVCGILALLFIGFTRLWHFQYIQSDPLVCALFGVERLPHVTTYWRCVSSLGHIKEHLLNETRVPGRFSLRGPSPDAICRGEFETGAG